MPVQMLQLCKCWLCDANINASANVTAMQMLAMQCQYKCQCKCYSYANVGYAMPVLFLYAICGYYFNIILLHGLLELLLPAVGDRSCYGGGVEEYAQEGESGGWAFLLRFC